jgi:hypothetical protein
MRTILPAVALLVVPLQSWAQAAGPATNPFATEAARQTMHLSVEPSATPTTVSAGGGTVTLSFLVTPKRNMHVYAPGQHQYQVVELDVARQVWLRPGTTKYPPSEIFHFELLDERVEVYSKPFRLTRSVTILSTPEARKALAGRSSVTIDAALAYQACDDSVCYRPAKVPVSFTVQIQ